ncbi:hypothetical protein H9657_02850 [Cellulomonas sp. Sa3CUA2]|uniref:Polysaccharide biosynthesis protein n=1 Tax=Cellulomonas avistercoris TaxID=2762242 RepID=A0ABR8Q9W2_9CELL|nr:hypothetical protein [Cellulomonas avistercoris]MBD7917215.1 hypothetical protein [Cellulomonas avistercoris]
MLIARETTKAETSAYLLGFTLSTAVFVLAGFGFSTVILRIGALAEPVQAASSMMRIRLLATLLTGGALATVLSSTVSSNAALAAVALAASDAAADMAQNYRAGRMRFSSSAAVIVTQRALPFCAALGSLALSQSPSTGVGLASALLITGYIVIDRDLYLTRTPITMGYIRQSRGYWLSSALVGLQQLDVTIVRLIGGAPSAAIYGVASRVGGPLGILVSSMVAVFAPAIAHTRVEHDRVRQLAVVRRLSIGFGLLIAASSPALAWILTRVLGPQYYEAQSLIIGVCIGASLSAVSQGYQAEFVAAGRSRRLAIAAGVGSATHLGVLATIIRLDHSLIWLAPILSQAIILATYLLLRRNISH